MDTTPNIITIYFYCSLITLGYNDKLSAILIFFLKTIKFKSKLITLIYIFQKDNHFLDSLSIPLKPEIPTEI